ncbi:hypothetical protein ATCCBAA256_16970 [Mycobacterium montefiorense]|nr:hypothetical protein ATCCBAA256_16970 [Mycobacterium montefiorense]
MLKQTRITGRAGEPIVTEGDAGKVQPRFGGVDHAWQTGKSQVTTQNPVRATAAEDGDELAGAGHPLTLAGMGPMRPCDAVRVPLPRADRPVGALGFPDKAGRSGLAPAGEKPPRAPTRCGLTRGLAPDRLATGRAESPSALPWS